MGKNAFITGATKGIGKGIAKKLALDGFNLAINYRNETLCNNLINELKEINKNIEIIKLYGDVSDYNHVEKMFSTIEKKWKTLDVLVNNSGITKDNIILKLKKEDFDEVLKVNLYGTFYCMKFASKLMLKNKYGRIISISSIVGVYGNPGQINYSASKAGIIAMTKSLAKEIGKKNITVNCISPGFIETSMTSFLNEDLKNTFLSQISAKRFGTCEDIGNLVSFLASEKSSYINGENIIIDGGLK